VTLGVVTAMPVMVVGMVTTNNQGPMSTMAEEVASPVSTIAEEVASPVSTMAEQVASPLSTMAGVIENLGGSQFGNRSGSTAKKCLQLTAAILGRHEN